MEKKLLLCMLLLVVSAMCAFERFSFNMSCGGSGVCRGGDTISISFRATDENGTALQGAQIFCNAKVSYSLTLPIIGTQSISTDVDIGGFWTDSNGEASGSFRAPKLPSGTSGSLSATCYAKKDDWTSSSIAQTITVSED